MDLKLRAHLQRYIRGMNIEDRNVIIDMLYGDSKAHGKEHIHTVLENAIAIKGDELNLEESLAIMFHDVGNRICRKSHEIHSATIFRKYAAGYLGVDIIHRITKAIVKHRGSYKGKFDNELEELVSSADRGRPDKIEDIILRSYRYAIDELKKSEEEAISRAFIFVINKYGPNGYANYPDMYRRHHKEELIKMQDRIGTLELKDVMFLCWEVEND